MLGHDFRHDRFANYSQKLSGKSNAGYNMDNFFHSRFETSNTSFIHHLLEVQFFWFGITEYMEASMCLLLWQLHIFNNFECSNLCGDRPKKSSYFFAHANIAKAGEGLQTLTQDELKYISSITKRDQTLYEIALHSFYQRAMVAERDVGFRFLNCHLSL